jgi:hypothetical protein
MEETPSSAGQATTPETSPGQATTPETSSTQPASAEPSASTSAPQPTSPPHIPPQPTSTEGPRRTKNGLGAASLVLGVSSLVALLSFILFPLAFIGGLVGVILGIIALLRTERGVSTNRGQSIAGITCSGIALIIAVVFAVRAGTWINDNRGPLRRLESCVTRADNSQQVGQCFSRFSIEITDHG